MNKRFLITLITVIVIIAGAGIAAFFTKGYTISPTEGRIVGTGIISVTSQPDGAAVYIDGHLHTATNTTISSLQPKKYKVRITKDGFIPWEKEVEVREGLVTNVKATLFPSIPTIYPLTYNGIINPILSPDGQKLAFAVPISSEPLPRQKGGIWVWTMSSQPIAFSRSAEPHQIVESTEKLDFSKAEIRWSPDSKQVLVSLQEGGQEGDAFRRNYLLSADQKTNLDDLRDVTPILDSILSGWEEDQRAVHEARIEAIEDLTVRKVASEAAVLKWSPDETKFMVAGKKEDVNKPTPTKNSTQKADQKIESPEYKDYTVYVLETEDQEVQRYKSYKLPEAKAYYWLPDSEHIILVRENEISIVEYDGNNVAVIYAGKFEDSYVFPWPDSSRLALVMSFPTPTASTPNLFGINLK